MSRGGICSPGQPHGREAPNPKHQIRNNVQNAKTKANPKPGRPVLNLLHWNFEFVSDFELGASDFSDRPRWLSNCDIVRRGMGLRRKMGSFGDFFADATIHE